MRNGNQKLSAIIDGCKAQKRRAQNELFHMFYGKMLGVAMRYTADIDDAHDVTQNAFVKVFEKVVGYSQTGSFEGWVRRIVTNTAIDFIRKQKHINISLDQQEYEWLAADEGEELQWNKTLAKETTRVMDEIQNLSPSYRLIFNMYVIEDYSHQEIAEMLNISVGTSKSNLSKAKRNLLKNLVQMQTA